MAGAQVRYFKPADISGLVLLTCPDASYLFPPHFHQAYCIWLNTSGGEYYRHRGNSYILQPDSFGIIAPGEVHENQACDTLARSLVTFYLDPDLVRSIGAQLRGREVGDTEFRTDAYRDVEVLRGLVALARILRGSSSTLERESAFLEVFAALVGRYGTSGGGGADAGSESARVARVIELFHAHLAEDISLANLASQLGCTPYHLIRFFKKAVGLSPHAYLVQLRLEKAHMLMAAGMPIAEVAFATGFADQSHLTRHFKHKFGIPPGAYLRQLRQG